MPLETPFITHPRACNCASGLCLTFHLCKVKARSRLNNKCQSSSVESVFVGVLKSWVTSVAQPSWPILLTHCKQPRLPCPFVTLWPENKLLQIQPPPPNTRVTSTTYSFQAKVGKMTKSRLSSLQCTISHWRDSISNTGKVFAAS